MFTPLLSFFRFILIMPCQRKLLQKLFVNIGFGSSFVLCVAAFVSLLHKSFIVFFQLFFCLLYTSDAADEL